MRINTPEECKRAIERQGEFGRLFLRYTGCPVGAKGRSCTPIEKEVFQMPIIKDVDGGEWTPVNADALNELVQDYIRLKKEIDE